MTSKVTKGYFLNLDLRSYGHGQLLSLFFTIFIADLICYDFLWIVLYISILL